jgi:IS605 OrfB family transposase
MEDLSKIKKNTSKSKDGFKRKRHNNAIAQVPFAEFKTRLTAKAHLFGKEAKTVSPVYTSQTDCRNDKRNGKRIGCRYYCKDGLVLDADWNAAVNIAKKGKHPFSSILPVDGRLKFLNGRVSSITQSSASLNGNGQAPHFREG